MPHCSVALHDRGRGDHDPSVEVREAMSTRARHPPDGELDDKVPF
jgi:hypothetical protein